MPKLDLESIEQINRTGYPSPYAEPMAKRHYRRLAPAAGLTDFGASHVVLEPGGISSQRHWHEGEDELVVMISGEAVLVDDAGETPMRAGDVAAFPKNDGNGHCLQNRSGHPCVYVAIGRTADTACHYPDIDMHLFAGASEQRRKDGSPF